MNWRVFWGTFLGVLGGSLLVELLFKEEEEGLDPLSPPNCAR